MALQMSVQTQQAHLLAAGVYMSSLSVCVCMRMSVMNVCMSVYVCVRVAAAGGSAKHAKADVEDEETTFKRMCMGVCADVCVCVHVCACMSLLCVHVCMYLSLILSQV